MSSATLHRISLIGDVLRRGFWLYVWEVVPKDGAAVLYVGMTGDSSSPNAQSPFTRLGQHLGTNKHANALARHLKAKNIEPSECRSLELVAYGPVLEEADVMEQHRPLRAKVAGIEESLRDALADAGHNVLNSVQCRGDLDPQLWEQVLNAFAERFADLKSQESKETFLRHELSSDRFRVGKTTR
ncbi:MAG TPA: hypothetical protein VFC29_16545 [Candidatus Limnocylindrales bacterium]|nr:hypothetical protein [Candidatus Limnocylindrales bacterium]